LKKNLALTGMMGVGKTSIGMYLSRRLFMKFIDIDKIIENELKMTIQKIFLEKGESFFRKYEEKITLQEIKKKNSIISLGGGAFMNSTIRKDILLNCKSFWLDLDTKLIEKRIIKSKKRPLLNDKNLKQTLEKIYNDRKDIYATANYRINCDRLNKNLITNKIIKLYANN
jgi:shikimate kinase|tara:strand:- start:331 stop:840 length:510 start_codon:yes stop_codon:yes gene_type:complete